MNNINLNNYDDLNDFESWDNSSHSNDCEYTISEWGSKMVETILKNKASNLYEKSVNIMKDLEVKSIKDSSLSLKDIPDELIPKIEKIIKKTEFISNYFNEANDLSDTIIEEMNTWALFDLTFKYFHLEAFKKTLNAVLAGETVKLDSEDINEGS